MESDCRVPLGRVVRDGLFKEVTSELSRSLREEKEPASAGPERVPAGTEANAKAAR